MRLLADESLTGQTRQFLQACGHEVLTVEGLGRCGVINGEVLALAKTHRAVVVAEDRGFGNLRDYPIGSHGGVVVVKIRGVGDLEPVHRHLREALSTIPATQLAGGLLIIDRNKYRLRRPA